MFKCLPCGIAFLELTELKQHHETSHTLTFACDLCALPFTHKNQLFKHRQRIHGIIKEDPETYLLNCIYCPKSYSKKTHLEEHINSVHFGVRYFCNKCDKQFTRARYLKTHDKNVHFAGSSPNVSTPAMVPTKAPTFQDNEEDKENVVVAVTNPAKRVKLEENAPITIDASAARTLTEEEIRMFQEQSQKWFGIGAMTTNPAKRVRNEQENATIDIVDARSITEEELKKYEEEFQKYYNVVGV